MGVYFATPRTPILSAPVNLEIGGQGGGFLQTCPRDGRLFLKQRYPSEPTAALAVAAVVVVDVVVAAVVAVAAVAASATTRLHFPTGLRRGAHGLAEARRLR